MKVCDADSHVTEPIDMWQEYVEPRYRARAPRLLVDEQGIERMAIDDKIMNPGPFALGGVALPGGLSDPEAAGSTRLGMAHPGGWDVGRRLADMDSEGIATTVVYPSVGLFFGGDEDPLLMGALCRAYNNWIADFCKQVPDRFHAMAMVPLMDVEASVLEVRRGVEQLGLKGVMIRPNPYAGRMLHDPAYAPFWRELQGLGVPVGIHEGATGNIPFAGADRCKTHRGVEHPGLLSFVMSHVVCHPHEQELAVVQMICGGVLERFPALKVGFMESGCGWLPYWLHRLDEHHETLGRYMPDVKLRPSEYFKRQCWIATEGEEADMASVLRYIGEDRVVWTSDYPHFDCKLPGSLEWREHSGLAEEILEKIVWKNAAALYSF